MYKAGRYGSDDSSGGDSDSGRLEYGARGYRRDYEYSGVEPTQPMILLDVLPLLKELEGKGLARGILGSLCSLVMVVIMLCMVT